MAIKYFYEEFARYTFLILKNPKKKKIFFHFAFQLLLFEFKRVSKFEYVVLTIIVKSAFAVQFYGSH